MSRFSARFSNPKKPAPRGEFERAKNARKKRIFLRELRRERLGVRLCT